MENNLHTNDVFASIYARINLTRRIYDLRPASRDEPPSKMGMGSLGLGDIGKSVLTGLLNATTDEYKEGSDLGAARKAKGQGSFSPNSFRKRYTIQCRGIILGRQSFLMKFIETYLNCVDDQI
jgi:hypothetical protein